MANETIVSFIIVTTDSGKFVAALANERLLKQSLEITYSKTFAQIKQMSPNLWKVTYVKDLQDCTDWYMVKCIDYAVLNQPEHF